MDGSYVRIFAYSLLLEANRGETSEGASEECLRNSEYVMPDQPHQHRSVLLFLLLGGVW